MRYNNTMKSVIFAAMALTTVSIAPAFSEDDGWFWNRGRIGDWFHGKVMEDHMRCGGGPGMMIGRRFSEERLNAIKTELSITAAQEKSWGDYAKSVTAAAASMRQNNENMIQSDLPTTLPERLTLHETMMSARLEEIKTLNAATLTLYNVLDTNQKKKADELIVGLAMM
jgi:LTXXQ motif family protein